MKQYHHMKHKPKKSFRYYYSMYFEKIYRYIFFRVDRDKATAEDLTSEIMLKAYENYDRFDHEKKFSVWIYRIAHNHLVDFYKKAKLDKVPLENADYATGKNENFGEKIDVKINSKEVAQILKSLPEKQRDIVILRFFDDLSHKEIADILDIKETYVRVSLHRAIQFIKERLSYLSRHI
jgi:RNA polymerase sigma-70 factor, ECF subfamily